MFLVTWKKIYKFVLIISFLLLLCSMLFCLAARAEASPIQEKQVLSVMNEYRCNDNIIFESIMNTEYPVITAAIIGVESDYVKTAVSRVGCLGLMQLHPKYHPLKDWTDARENIRAGSRFFNYLLRYYRGNLEIALAAYNAGPDAVRKYGGMPPYEETKQYVKKVLSIIRKAQSSKVENNLLVNAKSFIDSIKKLRGGIFYDKNDTKLSEVGDRKGRTEVKPEETIEETKEFYLSNLWYSSGCLGFKGQIRQQNC